MYFTIALRLRASLGALIGLLATGLIGRVALGDADTLPLLLAPMGASAVLLFAVPGSPLARPWPMIGGNVLSAVVGVTCATMVPEPNVAAALAGGLSIALMMTAGCLHPPGGAVALTAVLGGPSVQAAGFGFAIWPVGLSTVLLLSIALVFNSANPIQSRRADNQA